MASEVLEHSEAIELSGYQQTSDFDDGGYSALHRPGSWEWQLPEADAARRRLAALGYLADQDPEASWRVRWLAVPELQPGELAREPDGRWTLNGRPIHAGDLLELRAADGWRIVRFEWLHGPGSEPAPVLHAGAELAPCVPFHACALRWPV